MTPAPKIRIIKDGPYEVSGATRLARVEIEHDSAGHSVSWAHLGDLELTEDTVHLCRCGHSQNKPFCDGRHQKISFDGTETASQVPFDEQAKLRTDHGKTTGDVAELCVHAKFCIREIGDVWHLLHQELSEEDRSQMEAMVALCPSGRLTFRPAELDVWQEPRLAPSVSLVKDGQILAFGGIEIEGSDGENFEVRNRVSLCRCGHSQNKPFCDGRHQSNGFTDPEVDEKIASQQC
ncbi:CDGSH iron-sulfur domain-containing protein [Arcanobacterium canis]